MKLGVIADDFTGATDIAGFLVKNGVKTVQIIDRPAGVAEVNAEAYVVSLKSRSCDAQQAIRMSLDALEWLLNMGCDTIYFKYCSTFDSTSEGNIGPVADAIMERMNEDLTIVCPALPVNGRTLYKGYLFVHDTLLNESGMRNHPLNPMKDAKISRVLSSQTKAGIGEIHYELLERGPEAVQAELSELKRSGVRYVVVDTLDDSHLSCIVRAASDLKVFTGGSGLGDAIAREWKKDADYTGSAGEAGRPKTARTIIFSGSCSTATNVQVERYKPIGATLSLDRKRFIDDPGYEDEVFAWIMTHIDDAYAPMLYATTTPDELQANKRMFNHVNLGEEIENMFGRLAARLLSAGVKNFIVAGGETAGKIVQSLNLESLYVGPQIDPGVPWMRSTDQEVYLALKSGNFGAEQFFKKAQEMYDGTQQ
jgi:uncharacterized protein YgbK (DUF1537 family)